MLHNLTSKIKIIPVLAKTGGREALAVVLKEFENGNSAYARCLFQDSYQLE